MVRSRQILPCTPSMQAGSARTVSRCSISLGCPRPRSARSLTVLALSLEDSATAAPVSRATSGDAMAYFPDLTDYTYARWGVYPGTAAVGWLAAGHTVPTSPPSEALLDRLWQ